MPVIVLDASADVEIVLWTDEGSRLAHHVNLWFAVTASALHLPQDDPVAETIAEHWDVLSAQPSPEVLAAVVEGMPALHALRELTPAALTAAIEAERARRATRSGDTPPPGLLDAEWELFRHPTTTRHDADFRAVPTPTPAAYTGLLRQVVQVERLREVQAMLARARRRTPPPRARRTPGSPSVTPAMSTDADPADSTAVACSSTWGLSVVLVDYGS